MVNTFEAEGVNVNATLGENSITVPTTSTVLGSRTYVATEDSVLILNTNLVNASYVQISIGHKPIQIAAFELYGTTYLLVYYKRNERGYVAVYQLIGNATWAQYGFNHLLLTSPDWYDTSTLSNVVMYVANDPLFGGTIYTAFAETWNLYMHNMLDGRITDTETPESCDTITHLSYSPLGQALIVSCVETTLYYDITEDLFYDNAPLSSMTGSLALSEDGHFGVHVNTESASLLTVIDFRTKPRGNTPFNYFQLSTSPLASADYVTVGNDTHYFCYSEAVPGSRVSCIQLERAMLNVTVPALALTQLDGTWSNCTGGGGSCHRMHARGNLLGVDVRQCSGTHCNERVLVVYNMTSVENVWNVTGLQGETLVAVWMRYSVPLVLREQGPGNETNSSTQPTTTTSGATSVAAQSSSIPLPVTDSLVPGVVLQPSSSSSSPAAVFKPPTISSLTPQPSQLAGSVAAGLPHHTPLNTPSPNTPTGSKPRDSAAECSSQLEAANLSYQRLFWVTITISVLFSITMVFTIAMVIGLIYATRSSANAYNVREESSNSKPS